MRSAKGAARTARTESGNGFAPHSVLREFKRSRCVSHDFQDNASLTPVAALVIHAPRRNIRPGLQRIPGPIRRLVGVADGARIRNFQRLRLGRRDELKGVAADIHVGNRLLDFRHVAADALVPRRSRPGDACAASMVGACGPFGEFGPWHSRHSTFAGFSRSALFSVPWTSWQLKQVTPCGVHQALHEIVALHAVLVRRAVGEMREGLSRRACALPASRSRSGSCPT